MTVKILDSEYYSLPNDGNGAGDGSGAGNGSGFGRGAGRAFGYGNGYGKGDWTSRSHGGGTGGFVIRRIVGEAYWWYRNYCRGKI